MVCTTLETGQVIYFLLKNIHHHRFYLKSYYYYLEDLNNIPNDNNFLYLELND